MGFVEIDKKDLAVINQRLDGLPVKTRNQIGKPALKAGAKLLQPVARQLVPFRTGFLRKNTKVAVAPRSRTSIGYLLRQGKKDNQGNTHYAAKQEFGWKPHSKTGDARHVEGKHTMQKTYKRKGKAAMVLIQRMIFEGIVRAMSYIR